MKLPRLNALEADDIFISYSRLDGTAYLTGLEAALSNRGFSCFCDKRGTDADRLPPETLYRKIALCKTLVLLGTAGAVARPEHIETEVRKFAEVNGTARIILINFDRGRETLDDCTKASWNVHVVGKTREREKPEALITGEPTPDIVDSIERTSNYMKAKDRLRTVRNRAIAVLILLLIGILGALGAAVWLSKKATRQQTIAEVRSLANRSQRLLRQRPEALRTSIELALEGMAKASSVGMGPAEAETALRDSVAFLPRPMGRQRFTGEIGATALSPDGRHFAALESGKKLRVYSIGRATPVREIVYDGAKALALSNDGVVVAVNVESGFVIHDLRTGQRRLIENPTKEHSEFNARALAISPGGRYLAVVALSDYEQDHWDTELMAVMVWDTATGVKIFEEHEGVLEPRDVAFSANGDLAVGGDARLRDRYSDFNGRVMVWRLSDHLKDESQSALKQNDFVNPGVVDIPEPIRVVASSNDRVFAAEHSVWKRGALGPVQLASRLPAERKDRPGASQLTFTPDGRELLIVRGGKRHVDVERWDVTDRRDHSHAFLADTASSVGFSPDGFVSAGMEGAEGRNPRLFDVGSGTEIESTPRFESEESAAFVSRDARFVVTKPNPTSVFVHDAWQPRTVIRVDLGQSFEYGAKATLSREGEYLAIGGRGADRSVALVFARQGNAYRLTQSIDLGEIDSVSAIAITPDGRTVIVGESVDDYARARVWDVGTARETTPQSLKALASEDGKRLVEGIALSNSGRYLAVRAQNDPDQDLVDFDPQEQPEILVTIRLADGVEVLRHSFGKSVSSIVFSPGDTFLLASGYDLRTKLWTLDSGMADAKEMKNDVTVSAATFSADEQTFAIGALDGVVQLFATADPADELVRLLNTGKIAALAFSPDGKLIATASQRQSSPYEDPAENHALRVWLLDPVALMNDAKSRLAAFGGG